MTDIQIKYWDYVEGHRHNLAYETENNRHNSATEQQAAKELVETKRHNIVGEDVGWYNAGSERMNALSNEKNAESNRMNAYSNQRNAASNERNAETNRMNAYTNQRMASASETQAAAALRNSRTNQGQLKIAEALLPYQQAQAQTASRANLAKASLDNAKAQGALTDNAIKSATQASEIAGKNVSNATGIINNIIDAGENLWKSLGLNN